MFEPEFITYRGKQILRADYTGIARQDLSAAFARTGQVVTSSPPRSVRVLSILNTTMGKDVAASLKRLSANNAPHVIAVAVVGTSFWNVVVSNIQMQEDERVIQVFENEAAALDWLSSR
jgi:hypothetical protein